MSRSFAIGIVVVAALLVGGLALAFQEQKPAPDESPAMGDVNPQSESDSLKSGERLNLFQSTADWVITDTVQPPVDVKEDATLPPNPQWVVSAGGDATVLLEAKSGKTWVLHRFYDGQCKWLATSRIDDVNSALEYLNGDRYCVARDAAAAAKKAAEDAEAMMQQPPPHIIRSFDSGDGKVVPTP